MFWGTAMCNVTVRSYLQGVCVFVCVCVCDRKKDLHYPLAQEKDPCEADKGDLHKTFDTLPSTAPPFFPKYFQY